MPEWIYAPPTEPWLVVLYEDRDVVAVDKPSGLLSVPGRGPGLEDSAATRLARDRAHAWPAHRLDMDTSGVLLFALRRKAEAELHRQFRDRVPRKVYLARVAGHPADDAGLIDLPLAHEGGAPRSRVDPAGKPARTRWRVLERDPDGSALLELRPETGRSHQLRVHLLALGHPILGDRFYAPPAVVALAPRLMLHAASLTLRHPYSGDPLTIEAQAPPGLAPRGRR
ncbi:MAG: RNA pseudouridine synthase [Deltaproteobacteria bacterium HGW-Deltaproteobacteria-14]|nr:MAG: RNA pseudouridine synthase [Deltaproteobacteria bacterium HGW-Deltaproteobacteria-14]